VGIPPHRRDLLKILPPDLIEALRQPLPIEARRALIQSAISDELVRRQALRYVEELRLADLDDDDAPPDEPADPAPPAEPAT
jgi:hypothetical protein